MDGKKITADALKTAWRGDMDRLAEAVAAAINKATPGRIIADSEEAVRDASAVFRQRLYQQALDLLQDKPLQEDFSPSGERTGSDVAE